MRTVMVDDQLAALVEQEMPLDQATREELVMGLFRRGKISAGKASELLGLERLHFVRSAGELGVPVYLTTERSGSGRRPRLTHGSSRSGFEQPDPPGEDPAARPAGASL